MTKVSIKVVESGHVESGSSHMTMEWLRSVGSINYRSCRIASLIQGSFAKEIYNLIDPTNRSHPIPLTYKCIPRFLYRYSFFWLVEWWMSFFLSGE